MNVVKVARAMFNWGKRQGYIVTDSVWENPFSDNETVMDLEPSERDRALTPREIHQIWPAIDGGQGTDKIKRALKLILVTGQRPGEVLAMHHNQIHGKWWIIPPENIKTELFKKTPKKKAQREEHYVYLSDLALVRTVSGNFVRNASATGFRLPAVKAQATAWPVISWSVAPVA